MNIKTFIFAVLLLLTSCSPLDKFTTATARPTATKPAKVPTATTTLLSSTPEVCAVATGYKAGTLNIRTGPGTNYAVIRVLAEGEILKVATRGAWLKVVTRDNLTGYINSKFCR